MNTFYSQIKDEANKAQLSAAEKRDLKSRVSSYMLYHPLPHDVKSKSFSVANAHAYALASVNRRTSLFFNTLYTRAFAGVATIAIIIGVPLLAERAVPGDILYAIKVGVNEEVRSLTLSPIEKVEWETTRLERRIAEARLLASEGKLTPEREASIAASVEAHSDAATEGIAAIGAEDAEAGALASIALASTLEVQSAVLDIEKNPGTAGTIAAIVTIAKENVEKQNQTPLSFTQIKGQIERETTRANELFASIEGFVSPEEQTEIERRLADIGRMMETAIALEAGTVAATSSTSTTPAEVPTTLNPSTETSITIAKKALTATQKLISFMTDIDVRETVTVEELVPVVPTDTERIEALTADVDALIAFASTTRAAHPDTASTSIAITSSLNKLDETITSLETATDTDLYVQLVTDGTERMSTITVLIRAEATALEQARLLELENASTTDETATSTPADPITIDTEFEPEATPIDEIETIIDVAPPVIESE